MTYYNSAAGVRIDKARVMQELCGHGVCWSECCLFFKDHKPDSNGWYKAHDVLNWLGY